VFSRALQYKWLKPADKKMEPPPVPTELTKAEKVAAKKARKLARRAQRKAVQDAIDKGLPPPVAFVPTAAVSVAFRPLPIIPSNISNNATTICLCYQYIEPAWTRKQHKHAITKITEFAREHQITGRGRCAPEGLNCTLTASAHNMRNFCYALRKWNPVFEGTDFKLSDGEPTSAMFRTFTLRKVEELVGYGLNGIKAPSLNRHSGKHLEADQYHDQMKQKDTVIIDVRNAYESAIGHFQPPPGGAELLDPKMRDSTDFPKWLNDPNTKSKLHGKTVMMYCTGGIRCERATALLNQMVEAEEEGGFKTKDVVMARGGIERYLKTYPEGGFWKGKNYLFDKRMEQVPSLKTRDQLEQDVESCCCVCKVKHASYRGQFKCSQNDTCSVPVIVCPKCVKKAKYDSSILVCPLCEEGYERPMEAPDLIGQKRKLGIIDIGGRDGVSGVAVNGSTSTWSTKKLKYNNSTRKLFIGKLPMSVTATSLRAALYYAAAAAAAGGGGSGSAVRKTFDSDDDDDDETDEEKNGDLSSMMKRVVQDIIWIVDQDSQHFFGSAFVLMKSVSHAEAVVKNPEPLTLYPTIAATQRAYQKRQRLLSSGSGSGRVAKKGQKRVKRRMIRTSFAFMKEGEIFPPPDHKETEHPPR
jgi:predicted sulfurtransferase